MTKSEDIVRDILLRVLEACSQNETFTDAMARQIEREIRADWGGEEPYIAKKPPQQERRAVVIKEAASAGVSVAAEKTGLARSTIYRMLSRSRNRVP